MTTTSASAGAAVPAAPAGVRAFNHFNVSVADLDRSVHFYRDLLGLELLGRGRVAYPHLDEIIGLPGTDIEWAELAVPEGGIVELFRYHHPPGRPVDPAVNNPGTTHLAFTVRGIDVLAERLHDGGVETVSRAPVEIPFGDWAGYRDLYVTDPDGVMVELVEPPS